MRRPDTPECTTIKGRLHPSMQAAFSVGVHMSDYDLVTEPFNGTVSMAAALFERFIIKRNLTPEFSPYKARITQQDGQTVTLSVTSGYFPYPAMDITATAMPKGTEVSMYMTLVPIQLDNEDEPEPSPAHEQLKSIWAQIQSMLREAQPAAPEQSFTFDADCNEVLDHFAGKPAGERATRVRMYDYVEGDDVYHVQVSAVDMANALAGVACIITLETPEGKERLHVALIALSQERRGECRAELTLLPDQVTPYHDQAKRDMRQAAWPTAQGLAFDMWTRAIKDWPTRKPGDAQNSTPQPAQVGAGDGPPDAKPTEIGINVARLNNVRMPTKPAVVKRWRETWRSVKGMWNKTQNYQTIKDWNDETHPALSCSVKTMSDIIRAGEAGLLDK